MLQWPREAINSMIERAILDAEVKGVKVLSLGLLNQASKFKYLFAYIKCMRYLLLNSYVHACICVLTEISWTLM